MTNRAVTRARPGIAELVRGPTAVGIPMGSVIGAVVGGAVHGNPTGGAVIGSMLALLVVAFVIVVEVYTGALGVPRRRPFRPGDRFMGWRVVGRLRTTPSHTTEYEVRLRGSRGRLTLATRDALGDPANSRQLSHPLREIQSRHLVHPLDLGRANQFEYVITELDGSESLAVRVGRAGPLSGEQLFAVAAGLAVALQDIHIRGAVHGQVRPDQVAVGGARVALHAFDPIVRWSDANAYLAPEQTEGGDVATAKADVFSWASTVLFAATGRTPFTAEPRASEPWHELCPEWIRPVLQPALSDDPKNRPDVEPIVERLRILGREHRWRIVGSEPHAAAWAKPQSRLPARWITAALLGLALTALLPTVVPADPDDATSPRAGTPPTGPVDVTPPASPTDTVASTIGNATSTASTAAVATSPVSSAVATGAPTPASAWPTQANDGSPAFYAYLAASFILPDWVSCAAGHCLVGSGDEVSVFTERPIEHRGRTTMTVENPHQALTDLGLTPDQANSLLSR